MEKRKAQTLTTCLQFPVQGRQGQLSGPDLKYLYLAMSIDLSNSKYLEVIFFNTYGMGEVK